MEVYAAIDRLDPGLGKNWSTWKKRCSMIPIIFIADNGGCAEVWDEKVQYKDVIPKSKTDESNGLQMDMIPKRTRDE